MGKLIFLVSVVAIFSAFLGERVFNLRKRLLASREVTQNHLPNCRLIKGLVEDNFPDSGHKGPEYGSEDITILPNGLAIISTGLKYPGMPSLSDDPGRMYSLDLLDARLKVVELRVGQGFDLDSFNPHGISTYTDEEGQVYLFIVNHPQGKSQVEIFQFSEEDNSIVHLKTVQHELLYGVNDVVAVGTESFYATNDHYFSNAFLRNVEGVIWHTWCTVVYYSPEEVKVVSDGFYSANGINISPDKRYIYVSDIFDHKIRVMDIKENRVLVPVKSVAVGSLCDNIDVDHDTGDLWLGCHPNAWKILMYDPENPPGSEVIRIQNIHSENPIITQVYSDNGSVIEGSSVASVFRNKLLIGTVYHKALCCDLK